MCARFGFDLLVSLDALDLDADRTSVSISLYRKREVFCGSTSSRSIKRTMLDNYTTYALAAGDDQSLSKSQHQSLPQFPGEDSLQHVAMKWIETSVSRLAGMGLLSVARGGITPESCNTRV